MFFQKKKHSNLISTETLITKPKNLYSNSDKSSKTEKIWLSISNSVIALLKEFFSYLKLKNSRDYVLLKKEKKI